MKTLITLLLLISTSLYSKESDLCKYVFEYEDYCNNYQVDYPDSIQFLNISYYNLDSLFGISEDSFVIKGITVISKLDGVFYSNVYINNNLTDTNEIRLVVYHEMSHAVFLEEHSPSLVPLEWFLIPNNDQIRLMGVVYDKKYVDDCYVEEVIHEYFRYKSNLYK